MINSAAINQLKALGINTEIVFSDTRRTVYCEKAHRITDEKYILNITDKNVQIECSGKKSAFYALCDILKRAEENNLADGEYICSPCFKIRGYIEGFYGTPWTHETRKDMLKLMGHSRMNTHYYAPKDDPYHREKWRDKYPDSELSQLRELVQTAEEYFIDFNWCIAPGLSIRYSSADEFDLLMKKTMQLYSIGIRGFGLLLDDIDEELIFEEDKSLYKETVNAHIELINKYYKALADIDPKIRLTVCPTIYHGKGNEYYIAKLGKNISPFISVFWTGRDICSRELTSREAVEFAESTSHKPLYWDNYPVNDCSMFNEMHISPIINRDADLWKYSSGIISNCMEYAECSKIPLLTYADYLWDSEGYNSQASWENAINKIVGNENAEYFILFADHLYTSCLKDTNSRRMYAQLDKIEAACKAGNLQPAEDYLNKLNRCCEYLKQPLPLCKELVKWSEKFYIGCELLKKIFNYMQVKNEKTAKEILAIADSYIALPAKISNDINIKAELKDELGIK